MAIKIKIIRMGSAFQLLFVFSPTIKTGYYLLVGQNTNKAE